jgi:hypothetical protein
MVDVSAVSGWSYTVGGALLVLAMAAVATAIGRTCRRLRPTWLAFGTSAFVGGGCGLSLGFAVGGFALPADAALHFPEVARFLPAISAAFFAIIGTSLATIAAKPARAHRAEPADEAE